MKTIDDDENIDNRLDEPEIQAIRDGVTPWFKAISQIESVWFAKIKQIEAVNAAMNLPNIGDMIKIAEDDEDRTFRVFAARRLGFAYYERTDEGNREAINAALDKLEKSDDAQVAAAAKAGRSITREEYHELQK